MEEVTTQIQGEPASKRKVDRSAAYPARTIEDSIKFVGEIYKNFRSDFAKRDDIINLIENSHPRHVAAAAHYGLLDREKDSYQVTALYKTIAVNYLNDTERKKALLTAFSSPTLNKELIEKFDGDEIPPSLVAHLSRFHRITEDAAPLAADIFIKNAKYCEVLSDKNILNYKSALHALGGAETVEKANAETEQDAEVKPNGLPVNSHEQKVVTNPELQKLLPEMFNEEKIKIRLTGGKFAYLIYPLALNKKDIAILQKQIEQLDLIVE